MASPQSVDWFMTLYRSAATGTVHKNTYTNIPILLHTKKADENYCRYMYYVYILRSIRDRKLYIGFTNNIYRRISEHQHGKSDSTACRRPFQLIFYEAFFNKDDAQRRESYFKTTKGKTALKLMLHETFSS